jgi:regulator of sirC expression with transglutaminase-like and TPR domain
MTSSSTTEFPIEQSDIQNIFSEDGSALIPFLLKLDAFLFHTSKPHNLNSEDKIHNLIYNLEDKCAGLSQDDKILVLNDFIFNSSGYLTKITTDPQPEDFSFNKFFTKKIGNSLLLTLIYQYLAQKIDLPVYAIDLPPYNIVKWYRGDKSLYIDLSNHGRTFNQNEILEYLSQKTLSENSFEILSIKQMFFNYIQALALAYKKNSRRSESLTCLSLLIHSNENDLESLRERAQIYYDQGAYSHSYSDLKRFLSFVDLSCAPDEIKNLYQKLKFMRDAESVLDNNYGILH